MNVKRLSKRTLATFLSVLLLLSSLVAGSVTTANAATWSYTPSSNNTQNIYVYFDNHYTKFTSSRTSMLIVTDNNVYTSAPISTAVTNSNMGTSSAQLVYKNVYNDFESVDWANVKSIYFASGKENNTFSTKHTFALGEGKDYKDLDALLLDLAATDKYTAAYTNGLSLEDKSKILFIPSADNSTLVAKNLGATGNYSVMNLNQTVNVLANETLDSSGVNSIQTDSYFQLSTKVTTTTQIATTESPRSSESGVLTFGAVQCTAVNLKATAGTDYEFAGWYDNSSCTGVALSTSTTYTYYVNDTKTLYADFEYIGSGAAPATPKSYAQKAGEVANGTVSVSDGTNSSTVVRVAPSSSVSFTAIPDNNYQFDGWYDNASFTGTAVSTDDPYTLTVDSANTLYAKFSAIETSNNEGDDGTVPTETSPSNRNKATRVTDKNNYTTSLSTQAVTYYTDEVRNIDGYKTAGDVPSGVYATFEYLSEKEVNSGKDSFASIYRQKTNEDPSDIKVFEADDEDASTKYVSDNSLYTALYDIMSSTHTHGVSYAAYGRNSLAHYWLTTDSSSINAGDGDGRGVYTFFYSDVSDFNHENMQREHIWPKSKASFLMKTGLGGSDLHHLRPAYGKLNLLKLNWGFASIKDENDNSKAKSGWSKLRTLNWPDTETNKVTALWRAENNGETFIDVKDDVRGDVARILLYIYTRWNQPNLYSDIVDAEGNPDRSRLPKLDPDDSKDTGERVFYDKQTLLDWMEQDPVSEWEMKRNDLTQDIQGNRNVFIDYPELAWLLFDQTVPSDMPTPSGMAQNDSSKDIQKADNDVITNPVTLDFNNINGNGEAEVTAYDLTTKRNVKNGDQVARGDVITFTVIPDQSKITDIREFSGDTDTDSNANRYKIAEPNSSNEYTFTRQAGYFKSDVYDNTGYSKERIRITLNSNVTVLSYKVNSLTTSGNSGGSGDGMVTARIAGTQTMLENGDSVPNGTAVTLTFTPDYGSRFARVSSSNQIEITPTQISGTDTYQATVTLDCSSGSARTKKFTIYFAQTFNATAGSEDLKKHINNKGMRPDEGDNWKDETDFTENFEICGVQMKKITEEEDNKALRFVSVIDKNILAKAKSYGYVIGYTKRNNLSREAINRFAFSLVKGGGAGLTVDCTGSSNDSFGAYGKAETNTNYKYVTAAVHHLEQLDENGQNDLDTVIIARPYVELKSDYVATGGPSVIYGQYVDFNTGENFCACSGSYNDVLKLANEQ